MLAETNLAYQEKKAVSPEKNGLFDIWLLFVCSYRTMISVPTPEMIYTLKAILNVLTIL